MTERKTIGSTFTVTVDRPLGSHHLDLCYPVNYGYIKGTEAADGEEQDAYILGVNGPVDEFTGQVIAIIIREDDVANKWIVVPEGAMFTKEEIKKMTWFQEQYFKSSISFI